MDADRGFWRTLLRQKIVAVFNFRRCRFELRLDQTRGPSLLLQLFGIVIKVRREIQEQTSQSHIQRTTRPDWHIQWITSVLNFIQRHFELRLDQAGKPTLFIVLSGSRLKWDQSEWAPSLFKRREWVEHSFLPEFLPPFPGEGG
ncbi:hypothetical protein WMY93_013143 [Mugilogobius chulae]|uniref:Uncharacterized protein n=1 Tax=Mugilogobius chulae TaxID=88201 RepID=A0AAW0P898_9GOBI